MNSESLTNGNATVADSNGYPLDLPLLLQTIEDLLVEPLEKRLGRLIGKRPITRYLQADI
jgi:hypothetical protein